MPFCATTVPLCLSETFELSELSMLHLETAPRPSLDLHGFREARAFGCAHSRVATERASRVRDRNRSLPASTGTCAAPDLAPGTPRQVGHEEGGRSSAKGRSRQGVDLSKLTTQ